VHRYSNDEVLYHPKETAEKISQMLKYKSEHPKKGIIVNEGCFIATAAFGTPMAQEINILRRFRDTKMEPNMVGRNFIHIYYNVSPPLARIIAQSKIMKAFVRLYLKPLIRVRIFELSNKT
jgi:hypothetical protein